MKLISSTTTSIFLLFVLLGGTEAGKNGNSGSKGSSCTQLWGACTNDPSSCCDGSFCEYQNPYYSQCKPGSGPSGPPPTPNPTPAPTPNPTPFPTESPTKSTGCSTMWSECTNGETCCSGSACEVVNDQYSQCRPIQDHPTPAPNNCLREYLQCFNPGTKDNCCEGYECKGSADYARCEKDGSPLTANCHVAYQECTAGQTCCPGTVCQIVVEGHLSQCMPLDGISSGGASPTPAPVSNTSSKGSKGSKGSDPADPADPADPDSGTPADPDSGTPAPPDTGAPCQLKYNENSKKFTKVNGAECPDGLTCLVETAPGSSGIYDGICQTETCAGKADPDDDQDTGTTRVTICHRTCSETNPWVRITIDDDAWGGPDASGCGHQQHNVEDECSNKAPWTAWGSNRKDYLLKWHGTKEQVRADHPDWSDNDEKTYWRYWERACPYVNQDKCCDWDEGSCCGDAPAQPTDAPTRSPTPAPTPGPTTVPSSSPSESPSDYEGVQCPTGPVVSLIGIDQTAASVFPEGDRLPVQVTEMGTTNSEGRTTVSFRVCPSMLDDATSIFTTFPSPDATCEEEAGSSECVEYTAVCRETARSKFAIVNVFAGRQNGSSNQLPVCCGSSSKTKQYTFEVLCECPLQATS